MKNAIHLLRIIITGISLIWAGAAMSQPLTGRVLESGTNKPVRNASIYFDGTLTGTTADSTGSFTLYPNANSKAQIVVSAIGYETETITDLPSGKKVVIYLGVKQYDLETVSIKVDDGMSRRQKLAIFRREFLGTSLNASSCEILNEDDISLSYNKKTKTVKAFSEKPIVVRNRNLGYKINFMPVNIAFSPERAIVQGYQFFEEEPVPTGRSEIERARQATYLGSQMHFVRSLWNNELKKEGFNIYYGNLPTTYTATRVLLQNAETQMLTYDSIVTAHNNNKYIHLAARPLHIEYKGKASFLYKNEAANEVIINNNGYSDPAGLVWLGFMGSQRIGDALPLEYNMGDLPLPAASPAAATDTADAVVKHIVASADSLHSRIPAEKLYVQFDKPYYIAGDTMRLKAYLFDAAIMKASDKSGIVYLELANDTNKVVFRRMLLVGYGLATGNIILDKTDIPEGSYTFRAYTNLMRNFGEDLVFRKDFYISGNSAQNWLINLQTVLSKQSGKDNIRLGLQINQFNRKALSFRELDFRVLDGRKVVQRDKVKTDLGGNLDVNFNLPEKMKGDLSISLTDSKDEYHKMTIPVPVSREENIDLQFMPEGGNLVAGISSVVGFKAIGEDGKGVNVRGKVYNNDKEVATFNSSYKGMGSFEFTPKSGENYTAKINLNGTTKSFPLPEVKNNGTALKLINSTESDSIKVIITISPAASGASIYYLTGQSRGVIDYSSVIRFTGNNTKTVRVAKTLFPTGIVRFTLMNTDKRPLNERITYNDREDNLSIAAIPAKALAGTRDSVAIQIEVKDKNGNPVQGSFSLAVTDDGQVKTDSLAANILTSLLLTSDLKGTVEDPGHYLQQTQQVQKDLDNLLLTQGWIGYTPIVIGGKDVLDPLVPSFKAEPEFVIKGKVTNVFNKGSEATAIQLHSLKPPASQINITGNDGSFTFSGLPVEENMKYFLQAKNKRDKSFNVGIEVDEFKPAEFKASNQRYVPWYVNSDTVLVRQASMRAIQEARLAANGTHMLQEVTIKGKKFVNNSKNLNGAGEADQILDEKDVSKVPKKTLLDLMEERVRGFNTGIWPTSNNAPVGINSISSIPIQPVSGPGGMGTEPITMLGTMALFFEKFKSYRIFDKEMHVVVDGVDLESLYSPTNGFPYPTTNAQVALQRKVIPSGNYILERNAADADDRYRFIKVYLENILAEDVKGIEVMYNPKYNSQYKKQYASNILLSLSIAGPDFAYVEITTYSGNGAYLKTGPGVYLHRPISYVNTTKFYRPRYVVKTNPMIDYRSTIHWEPDIVTDKNGKANVSFYAADKQGTYSIIMEGSDMKGSLGRKTGTITIK
jgi:hypothetical protein